jgi:hypothetical protein
MEVQAAVAQGLDNTVKRLVLVHQVKVTTVDTVIVLLITVLEVAAVLGL